MTTRVNLLQADECRQQTTISRETLIRYGGIGGAVLAVACLGWIIWQYHGISRRHHAATREWAAIRDDYDHAKSVQEELNTNRSYLSELTGWSEARVSWREPFDELKRIVPENLQITRLSVFGEIQVPAAAKSANAPTAVPIRRYALNLEGVAEGKLSDQDVIRFVDSLRMGQSFSPWLASVKLQGLQRQNSYGKTKDGESVEVRTFRVDALSKERPIK
jgi:hypothetical protein